MLCYVKLYLVKTTWLFILSFTFCIMPSWFVSITQVILFSQKSSPSEAYLLFSLLLQLRWIPFSICHGLEEVIWNLSDLLQTFQDLHLVLIQIVVISRWTLFKNNSCVPNEPIKLFRQIQLFYILKHWIWNPVNLNHHLVTSHQHHFQLTGIKHPHNVLKKTIKAPSLRLNILKISKRLWTLSK